MRIRSLALILGFVSASIASIETANAHLAEELMLQKIARTCRIGSGQTSVPSGLMVAETLAVVSKSPSEILSPNAAPQSLLRVPYEYSSPKQMGIYVPGVDFEEMEPAALNALMTMLDDANAELARTHYDPRDPEAHKIHVHSGYRTYDAQCRVFNRKIRLEKQMRPELRSEAEAIASVNSRSALPGQSEHQLGTAVDLVTKIPGIGYEPEPEMDRTPGFAWLRANAFRYGYAMSYPRGAGDVRSPNPRTGYVYEPWHWRYVGIAHATAFEMCARRGLTLQEYLRAIKANPYMTCESRGSL